MTSLEQWSVPLAVFGLLVATLLMAAVARRQQEHQARVTAAVRRIETGLQAIEQALGELRSVSLSRELRVTLRSDALARYRKIGRLQRRYPGIGDKIRDAEAALDAEHPGNGQGVGPFPSEQAFRRTIAALDTLIGVMNDAATLLPIPADVRKIFRRELGERRAEAMSRFHLVEAQRQQSSGSQTRARAHLSTLLQVLRNKGPSTDFVRELYAEAQHALGELSATRGEQALAE